MRRRECHRVSPDNRMPHTVIDHRCQHCHEPSQTVKDHCDVYGTQGKLPCFVLQHEKKRFRMVKAHHKPPPSTETVVEFVRGVLDGSVKPWVRAFATVCDRLS